MREAIPGAQTQACERAILQVYIPTAINTVRMYIDYKIQSNYEL